jgi:SAM-dependent methyltransferase
MMGSFDENKHFDLQFIDQMSMHHEGALMSSEHMISDSKRPELRQLYENIQKSQSEQIEQMQKCFDAAVATLVFCTIPDPLRALREVRRVLKPDGSFHLLEHVKVKRQPIAWIQEKATPVWKHLAGGCHLNRDTVGMLQGVGFEVEQINPYLGGLFLDISARAPKPK